MDTLYNSQHRLSVESIYRNLISTARRLDVRLIWYNSMNKNQSSGDHLVARLCDKFSNKLYILIFSKTNKFCSVHFFKNIPTSDSTTLYIYTNDEQRLD